jgi:glycosyltransferase involved in cell wall biosynthesis
MSGAISVVIPVYRAEPALRELVERLEKVLSATGRTFEVIFVDDRSPDKSWQVLTELKSESTERSWMKLVRLLKNSGQHNALLCGLSRATGDVVITMDDDLQHPPEELPKLIGPIDKGLDLVVGAFAPASRKGFTIMGGRFVDWTLRRIFGLPSDFQLTSLRAMRGAVATQAGQMTGAYPYVTAMVLSHATALENVQVEHAERAHGVSNYNLWKSLKLSFNLLLNYSSYPLYAMMILCGASLTVFAGLGLTVLILTLKSTGTVPGWASTLLVLAFSNSAITLALLIQFFYVTRMSHQIARSRVSYAIGDVDG